MIRQKSTFCPVVETLIRENMLTSFVREAILGSGGGLSSRGGAVVKSVSPLSPRLRFRGECEVLNSCSGLGNHPCGADAVGILCGR